jgi:putative nucleotidyltransferase with HDIG domain
MKHRLLFVDDEPRVLQGLKRMLWSMRDEWDTVAVASAAAALDALEASPFAVVITDMRMPDMTGVELLEKVRERHPAVVRIILSGEASHEAALTSVGPAHQFLSKPCDTETLKATIRRTLGTRQLLSSERLQDLVSQVGSLPSPPLLFLEIAAELQAPEPSMRRVADIIAADPAMTAKVLQLVNSAFFGIQRVVSDPYQATMLLGLKTVSAIALSLRAFAQFEPAAPHELGLSGLMSHSLRVATLARRIGSDIDPDNAVGQDCTTAGLLHDVGKLVLASRLPDRALEVVRRATGEGLSVADAERDVLGSTHAEIGGYLLGLWGLPDRVVEAVAFHHAPVPASGRPNVPLAAVHIANVIDHERQPTSLIGACPSLDLAYLAHCGVDTRLDDWRRADAA